MTENLLRIFKLGFILSFFTIQAVIQNPFSNGGSPVGEAVGGETRFAYFPAPAVSDGTATAVSVQTTSEPTITQGAGEFALLHLTWPSNFDSRKMDKGRQSFAECCHFEYQHK